MSAEEKKWQINIGQLSKDVEIQFNNKKLYNTSRIVIENTASDVLTTALIEVMVPECEAELTNDNITMEIWDPKNELRYQVIEIDEDSLHDHIGHKLANRIDERIEEIKNYEETLVGLEAEEIGKVEGLLEALDIYRELSPFGR